MTQGQVSAHQSSAPGFYQSKLSKGQASVHHLKYNYHLLTNNLHLILEFYQQTKVLSIVVFLTEFVPLLQRDFFRGVRFAHNNETVSANDTKII